MLLFYGGSSDLNFNRPNKTNMPPIQKELPEYSKDHVGSDTDLIRDELLHEIFETKASQYHDKIAVEHGPDKLTYQQLDERANQLAHYLRNKGVRRDSLVALLLPQSAELYVALLAILKAGAAYVPLDPNYPSERIRFIIGDCKAQFVLTNSALVIKTSDNICTPVLMDADTDAIAHCSKLRLSRAETETAPTDLCYVIYTSGTTGRPKGVQVEHRSVCHLVRAEGYIFDVQSNDRVYQGFSIAFDASVEEVWLAFFAGATLVVATLEMLRAGPDLPRLLAAARVTVLSCVPTLLSMMDGDIPSLRLLIVGGEACHLNHIRRWSKPGRRMVNTYGPTEATVISTYGDVQPDEPVTIGRPLPGYRVYILNEEKQPVPSGEIGELYIGGIGLARGYVGLPDINAQRFLPDPFQNTGSRIYRTGDQARLCPDGRIEYCGRIDTQVKIRGFRVELEEIEAALLEYKGVNTAAVVLHNNPSGAVILAGYVVLKDGEPFDEAQLKIQLRGRLPEYMIPSFIEILPKLPLLPSGKIDRKRLPAFRAHRVNAESPVVSSSNTERKIIRMLMKHSGGNTVNSTDDFFIDLGGHSLMAAHVVSDLRQDPDFQDLSMTDLYNFPTAQALARELEDRQRSRSTRTKSAISGKIIPSVSKKAYAWCVTAQTAGLYFILGFFSFQWFAPFLAYAWLSCFRGSAILHLVMAFLVALLAYPIMLVAGIVLKWLIIGRYRAGEYPLWGGYYLRWWLVNRILSLIPTFYLEGTPLINIYYRLLGAHIGHNVFLGTHSVSTFDLIFVGNDTSIGTETFLSGYQVIDGKLKIGPIRIGERCYIGARSIIQPNAEMEDNSRLKDLSLLAAFERIPRRQCWVGSPARPLPKSQASTEENIEFYRPNSFIRFCYGIMHAIGVLAVIVLYLTALFPGVYLMNEAAYYWPGYWFLALSPVVALLFIVVLMFEIIIFKRLLLGRLLPGRYRICSWLYFRKWLVDRLLSLSLDELSPVYATLYLNPWYRALGAKLGKLAEVSTACSVSPDLLVVGERGFIADAASLNASDVDRGWFTLAVTRIGERAFIGNSAMIPPGAVIGNNSLIGVLSTAPLTSPGAAQPNTSWLGSPALFLPKRLVNTTFQEDSTFNPKPIQFAQRLFIEYFRITLPATFIVAFIGLFFRMIFAAVNHYDLWLQIFLFPLYYAIIGICAAFVVIAIKWLLMGHYRPTEKPLWCPFVWRTELLTALHENLANTLLVEALEGTPWICWFFRLLGAKIGRRVYMETPFLTEFDLIRIGDNVCLGFNSTLQTHLFEDRVMKMGTIDIRNNATVGAGSVVLYDTVMQQGAVIDDLTLLMKGETLPAKTHWRGSPAHRIR